MRIDELDHTISKINQALLKLYYAKENGYEFYDFYKNIEKMLHLAEGAEDRYKNIISDFSNVFNDLLKTVIYITAKVKEIDKKGSSIIWEYTKHNTMSFKESGIEDVVIKFDPDTFKTLRYKVGDKMYDHNRADMEILKYRHYLPDDFKGDINEYFFVTDTIDLFKRKGYEPVLNGGLTFEKYISWYKDSVPDKVKNTSNKLQWKGSKVQLYSILRQLKEKEMIGNSYNSLAEFLVDNVVGFDSAVKETHEKELKKKKPLPKNKRINLDIDSEEEENK